MNLHQFAEKMRKPFASKKGTVFDQLGGMVTSIVALAVVMAIGFLILTNIAANATVAADGNASAALTTIINALGTIPGWISIMVLIFIGILMLGLVMLIGRTRN